MTTLIIGSTAMAKFIPSRSVKDYDVFSNSLPTAEQGDVFWHPRFSEWLPDPLFRFATLDELYTIKASHAYWALPNGSWNKHMHDMILLKRADATLDLPLHDLLYSVWVEKHGAKRVNLNMDKSEFFDDAVTRIYDHDSIHYSVAYGDRPIYEGVFDQGANIKMDMAAIKALPFETQIRLYREEIYATALERYVIPSGYRISPRKAYAWALQKTIVSLTKGWSARFIVDNYETFIKPDMDYVAWHRSKAHELIRLDQQ
jgi:hypothetical protein